MRIWRCWGIWFIRRVVGDHCQWDRPVRIIDGKDMSLDRLP